MPTLKLDLNPTIIETTPAVELSPQRLTRVDSLADADAPGNYLSRCLMWIPQVCSPCRTVGKRFLRRRAEKAIRNARAHCSRIYRERETEGMENDPSIPLEHIRVAGIHLAIVERWLKTSPLQTLALPSEQDFIRSRLPFSDEGGDHEEEQLFRATFCPSKHEVLFKVLPCLVLNDKFRHPGKMFLTAFRICFYSSVMGVEIIFSVSWDGIAKARLHPSEAGKTYPVRFHFRRPCNFNDEKVHSLEVRLFDLLSLGHLHTFAMYFTGTGLFGVWQDMSQKGETLVGSESPKRGRAFTGNPSISELMSEIEEQETVFELERRTSVFQQDWRAPFLPHDGRKSFKWVQLQDGYNVHAAVERSMALAEDAAACTTPPIHEAEVFGKVRPCHWNVLIDEDSDCFGWQYAIDFYQAPSYWSRECGWYHHVRRRRWRPSFALESSSLSLENDLGSASYKTGRNSGEPPLESLTDWLASSSSSPSMSPKQAELSRMKTTILAERGLRAELPLLEKTFGAIPLSKLAESLREPDWQASSAVMSDYFKRISAKDLEIGPWAEGHIAAQVKGQLRSVEMRVPVPAFPMAPAETRLTVTWHVVVEESKVVLESSSMSLDVPYGTCFNVVACDTFTSDDQGNLRLRRTLGLDWVKSCWMKSMVEANAPTEVRRMGEVLASVVEDWWAAQVKEAPADDIIQAGTEDSTVSL
mmetsp:Transcript_18111/g.39065  ORF Transcript_18111/g.39065 Transcript_18111/m.39065 type:complete len:698 (-) Transcript_18111:84-2177(-)